MKILRIIARLNVGGPAKHVVWLTHRMRRRGHDSVLVAGTVPAGEKDMGYFAEEHGVIPVYLKELSRELSPKDVVSLFKIYNLIRRERPDVIHTHTAKAGAVGRAAAALYKWLTPGSLVGRPRKVRVVHTYHGHVFHSYYGRVKTGTFRMIERSLARFATDRIIVISDQQLREINSEFGVGRREQFSVVPLGIEVEQFKKAGNGGRLREELGVGANTLIVGCVGRLTEIKDIPLLLAAVKKCSEQPAATSIHFAIVGDGNLRAELERMVSELGIERLVTFLGNRSDVADIVAGMDIVVLTSKNEGTPLSLIEAMAAGKTVIATPVGGVVDLVGQVTDKKTGFDLCERGIAVTERTPEAVAEALIYAAQNEKLRVRLSRSGQEFVERNYSVSRLESDIARLYAELVGDGLTPNG